MVERPKNFSIGVTVKMGIKELPKVLKEGLPEQELDKCIGSAPYVLAVDAACWIFPACKLSGSVEEIVTPVAGAALTFMKRIKQKTQELLRSPSAKVILVLDGRRFPPTRMEHEKRNQTLQRATQCLRDFESTMPLEETLSKEQQDLYAKLRRDVSQPREDLVHDVITWAKDTDQVAVIQAPYEADAQLVYLQLNGIADHIVGVDSDIFAYGAKSILFHGKRNLFVHIQRDKVFRTNQSLSGLTGEKFLWLCVLLGCDFIARTPGFGLKNCVKTIKGNSCLDGVLKAVFEDMTKNAKAIRKIKKHLGKDVGGPFSKRDVSFIVDTLDLQSPILSTSEPVLW